MTRALPHQDYKKRISILPIVFVLAILLPLPAKAKGLTIDKIKGKSGSQYAFFERNDLALGWETTRPKKSNPLIKLCIPAAFTTKSGTVVGIYCCRGKVGNRRAISKPIGGAILSTDGDFRIFPTKRGAIFTNSFVESLKRNKASLFQQFQIVTNGTPARFKDKKSYQMRAIVELKDGREGIVESKGSMTFKRFNHDLAAMGVKNALYTDMGAWDEGWYRAPSSGRLVTIGNDRSATEKQSNWVVLTQIQ